MAGIQNRPFSGTWRLNNRSVVKYTPDALVFINGDTSLPGCPRCRGRIDIQKFVTSMSIEAGTTPGSHSANLNLTLPRVQGQQVFIDGSNILRVGLEVHIFFRGYFPMRGMFSHLPNPNDADGDPESDAAQQANLLASTDFPNAAGTNRLDMSKYATYPYYPVFHGVVTQVSYDYADGFYTGSLNCASLLHFWQYQNMVTSGAFLPNSAPSNNPGKPTLFGHNFNNMHPFAIIYTLYRDIAGAAMAADFAQDEATNLDAVSTVDAGGAGGPQVFDMVSLYWEQRFKTRVQSLRMYGVNGQLFNAAQQAWLGSASNRDVDALLPSPTYNDSASTRTEQDPFSSRQSVAKALGLQNAGTDFVFSPLIGQDNELYNLSVLDMFAFNQAMAEIGDVNKYETTYQTKMDIGTRVAEVTGYELYQDVDGDLVFKPPFYNLDVATNRFYRLEDADIVSISFTEKEPAATYQIVRGVWIAGFTDGTKTNNEMLKRGLYVDYKLVAQFGWRPGPSLDLTYVTDPKVCFWIAVARLDLMNVDTFSASATIPIRPEIRPGYPVYIPFVDCYYYINQISHQFAFGGQCTTNLTLNCRRAKFHAPGFLEAAPEGQSAINLIRLDRPDLPPRPLEIFDKAFVGGREPISIPRLVGFPNVVMALDPRKFDPNFSLVGIGIDYFDSVKAPADLLFIMLQRDVNSLNAFSAAGVDEVGADGQQAIADPTQISKFKLSDGRGPDEGTFFTLDDLREAFATRRGFVGAGFDGKPGGSLTENRTKQVEATLGPEGTEALTGSENSLGLEEKLKGTAGPPSASRTEAFTKSDDLRAQEFAIQQQQTKTLASEGQQLLDRIFAALQPSGNNAIRRKVDGIPGSDVQLSWFQSMSHLKGQYMADTLPGQYRYFSCSHPEPSMQGMPIIEWDDGEKPPSQPRVGQTPSAAPAPVRQTSPGPQTPALPPPRRRKRALVGGPERRRLQQLMNNQGVGWASAGDALRWKNSRRKLDNRELDETTAQNIANIGQAVQILIDNYLNQNPTWVAGGYQIFPGSNWRPTENPEDDLKGSFHKRGMAWDIGARGGFNTKVKNFTDLDNVCDGPAPKGTVPDCMDPRMRESYLILKDEASRAWADGVFGGYGFYEARATGKKGNNKPFVHVDVRPGTANWSEYMSIETGDRNKKLKAECKKAPDPAACFESVKALRAEAVRRAKEQRRKATAEHRKRRTQRYPVGSVAPPPPPRPAPPPAPTAPAAPSQPLASPPEIKVTELSLETARTVVQFQKTVTKPSGSTRFPEAELGLGKVTKGLQLALGPQRTPRVTTTDQIQSISFVRHKASKFTQVTGVSVTAGRNAFPAQDVMSDYQKELATGANQLVSTGDETVSDAFRDQYEEIGVQIETVEIPIYENGVEVEQKSLMIKPFEEVVVIKPVAVDPNTGEEIVLIPDQVLVNLGVINAGQIPDPSLTVPVANLTFNDIIQLTGFKTTGSQTDTSATKYQRAIENLATRYANSITGEVEAVIADANKRALEPASEKLLRLAKLSQALSEMLGKSSNPFTALAGVAKNQFQEIASKQGKVESPLHSPVFPVSDEKGYQHYGAYRYGRGLTTEPGGTFEFIHSGQDPFKNVTAQTAEEFLKILTLKQQGKVSAQTSLLGGIRDAAFRIADQLFGEKQTPLEGDTADVAAKTGATPQQQQEVQQALLNLAGAVEALATTADGQDVLRELLTANGDNPNLITQQPFNITDTQFARNFANFAVNYGKSAVFKTTVANAAWQLSDLTSHLLARAGEMCVCRGSYSDIVMGAYSRDNFINIDPELGIDREKKPEQFQVETMRAKISSWRAQQDQYRGAITQGKPADAKAFENAGGSQAVAIGGGAPLPTGGGGGTNGAQEGDAGMVTPENPPTTVNPFEDEAPGGPQEPAPVNEPLPNVDDPEPIVPLPDGTTGPLVEGDGELPPQFDPEAGFLVPGQEGFGAEDVAPGAPTDQLGDSGLTPSDLAAISGISVDDMTNILLDGTPAEKAALVEATGFSVGELSVMMLG